MKKSPAQLPGKNTSGASKIGAKSKSKRLEEKPDGYPEEFEEFRSMDLRMKAQPFKRKKKDS